MFFFLNKKNAIFFLVIIEEDSYLSKHVLSTLSFHLKQIYMVPQTNIWVSFIFIIRILNIFIFKIYFHLKKALIIKNAFNYDINNDNEFLKK